MIVFSFFCFSIDSRGGLREIFGLGVENLRVGRGFGEYFYYGSYCYYY